ncbi:MAG: hypothetical protein NTY02_03620, partial [Acidobacteria bacterium]|nr:hypothetical protein [Acidobacteriota bacterium]
MRTTSLLLLLALAVPAPLTAAPPGAGASSQGTQDLAALKAAAAKGDAQAQLDYAKALKPPESRIWAQKAADQGLAEAWFWLGYTMNGDATPFYEKAAEKGYAEAFSYLLENLLFRAGPKADVAKAKKFADLARTLNVNLGSDAGEELWTIDRCSEAGAPDIPAADAPTKEESAAVGGEDCEPLRVGRTPDLKKYRACLLSETPPDNNLVAELYANGWGVKRNPRLAIALVCHASEVPAELMGMVKTLHETRTQAALKDDFLFCDNVTSGMNQGACADRAEKLAAATRDAAL